MESTTINGRLKAEDVKRQAAGRWPDILQTVCGLSPSQLNPRVHGPCPMCGGKDRFRAMDDVAETGGLLCNGCHNGDTTPRCGDGLSAVQWLRNVSFPESLAIVADALGMAPTSGPVEPVDIIAAVCRAKRMPLEAFKQFVPTAEKRGRNRADCARVPVWNENGETHSYFDLTLTGKGYLARGKGMSGMFFPGRLPQPGETWHIVEGVKDAAALIGLGFDAAGLPSSFMADKYAELFRGVNVVLVPDLDEPEQLGSQKTGGNLSGIAASVRVARLPGELLATNGDDVRDVLKRPNGEQLVRDAIQAAELWQPREGEPDTEDGRPEVVLTLNYGWGVDQVTGHLGNLGWESPWIPSAKRERLRLFHRGGVLVHVVVEQSEKPVPGGVVVPQGAARIRPLPVGQMPLRIADACRLLIEVETDEGIVQKSVPPSKWLIEGVSTRGDYSGDVRRLDAIITAPTLRPDGTILQAAGYDAQTGLLYIPGDSFPRVPQNPTIDDARQAAEMLLNVVADFEFESESDRAAWVALVLTYIGRPAIDGCTPFFAVTATTPGAGKSLAVDAGSEIAYGRPAARKPFSGKDEETQKAITATALEALPAVLMDNLDRPLGGAPLDAALTALTWSDRVLGFSKTTGDLPLKTVWSGTGNNVRYKGDFARRVLPIRLATSCERPEERTGFEHPNLLAWVRDNRPKLAVAALTILRAYVVAGRPEQPGGKWGSFDEWSDLVRGSIVWCGLADPLVTRETAKDDDASGAIIRGLIGGLLEMDENGDGLTARQIVKALEDDTKAASDGTKIEHFPAMREAVAECGTNKGRLDAKTLSYSLRKYRGRISNGWKIIGEQNRTGVICWKAKSATAGDAGDAGDSFSVPTHGKLCVTHNTHNTHMDSYRDGAKSSPASPASPAPAENVEPDIDYIAELFQ